MRRRFLLMKTNNNLLGDEWKTVDNWEAKYSEAAHSARKTFVFNDFMSFVPGKSYEIKITYSGDGVPTHLRLYDRVVTDGDWETIENFYFTTTEILESEKIFEAEENHYYMLWTNKSTAALGPMLELIENIEIREVV